MNKIYLGIDPGKSGAIGVLNPDGSYLSVWDMPDTTVGLAELINDLTLNEEAYIILEKVHSMPTDSSVAAFEFGRRVGNVEGVLAAYKLGFTRVSPQTWKRSFGLIGKDKEASRILASEMWPKAPLNRKLHHGRAEALLLAEYLRKGG